MSPFHSFALWHSQGAPSPFLKSVPLLMLMPSGCPLGSSPAALNTPCHVSQAVISDIAHVCKKLGAWCAVSVPWGISNPPTPEDIHITGTGRGGALRRAAETTEKGPQGVPFCVSLTLKNTPRGYVIIFFAIFAIFHLPETAPRLGSGA